MLLVGSSRSVLSVALVREALRVAAGRPDVEVVAVCDTSPTGRASARAVAGEALAAVVKPLFGAPHPAGRALLLARGLPGPVVRPPRGDPNDASFLGLLETTLRPDASLWLGSVRIALAPLLARVPRSVNYHNGSLPAVRGLHATSWSVYEGHETTGFSFHLMEEEVDAGPVLVSGALPIGEGSTAASLERAKTAAAARALPAVLDAIVRGDEGTPQRGTGSFYRQQDRVRIGTVEDPATVTWDDLERRLRAFGTVRIRLPAGTLEMTRARRLDGRPGDPGLTFTTADGVRAEAVRFRYLPLRVYRPLWRVQQALARRGVPS